MSHVSIKIRTGTLQKLRLLSALTGKRITTLIDDWASGELAKHGPIDTQRDTQEGGSAGSDDADLAQQKAT